MKTKNNLIGPMAPTSLFILACHICVQRLRSTVSGLREELYHRPWHYYIDVPEAPTTTTYDVLSPAALMFILLFANDITKLQHTSSTNMPNGNLCSSQSQHPWYNAHVPPSVDQHGDTQLFNIHVFTPHLLHDISRDATYSPPHATVSTSSAQRQI